VQVVFNGLKLGLHKNTYFAIIYSTMKNKVKLLKNIAAGRMKTSKDPVHDFGHVKRVVEYTEEIISTYDCFNKQQKQALILAAWWHDIGRTITNKKPFFIATFFIDDILSALSLWFFSIKHGLFGSVVGISTRIIFCHSFGAGAVLTKLLLTDKSRKLLNVLRDADQLDLLNKERAKKFYELSEKSRIYQWGYKTFIWWYIHHLQLQFYTPKAKSIGKELASKFLKWFESEQKNFHKVIFGERFTNRSQMQLMKLKNRL
jgi:hypothetical protein